MGRLSGYKYRQIIKKLSKAGFSFLRQGKGSHEIWYNNITGLAVVIAKHQTDMKEGTLRAILKEASIDVDTFLEL